MKLVLFLCFYALFHSVIFGQLAVKEGNPLSLKIEAINQKVCLGESFDLKVELLNSSSDDIVIDINGLGDSRSFSTVRIKNNKVTSSNRSEIGDSGPYYKGKFVLLKPNESYRRIQIISIKDSFFETTGNYRVKIGYQQFLNAADKEREVWRGSVYSNIVNFTVEKCQKPRVKNNL